MAYEDKETPDLHDIEGSLRLDEILGIHADGENIAESLGDEELRLIGSRVVEDYKRDKESREGWDEKMKDAILLAMQYAEERTWPWEGASNVKFPLLTVAVLQFASRIFPALVKQPNPVSGKVNGWKTQEKVNASKRMAMHMSYQLTQEMTDWVDDQDLLCHIVPITGIAFKKTYRDHAEDKNVSELVLPNKLVYDYYAKNVEAARCKTEVMEKHAQWVLERKNLGVYRDCSLAEPTTDDDLTEVRDLINETVASDSNKPYTLLEQHTWWDLDGDGYEEPYVITVEEGSKQVLRIVPRFGEESILLQDDGSDIAKIEADEFYTQYIFIPDPSGGNLGLGWGSILSPINETVNSLINQLMDSGTLNNLGGGLVSRELKMPGGQVKRRVGEFTRVNTFGMDLSKSIYPWPRSEPSQVLYQMLVLMIDWGQRITAVSDAMSGQTPPSNVPATTTLAILEQGQKVFQGIYGRFFRAMDREIKKLKRLNRDYMDAEAYYEVLDDVPEIPAELQQMLAQTGGQVPPNMQGMVTPDMGVSFQTDYDRDDTDITLSAETQLSSEQIAMARLRLVMEITQGGGIGGKIPNPEYVEELTMAALSLPNSEAGKLFVDPPQQQPSPELVMEQDKQEHDKKIDWANVEIQAKRVGLEGMRARADAELRDKKLEIDASKASASQENAETDQAIRMAELTGDILEETSDGED